MHSPNLHHLQATYWLLKFLMGTIGLGLLLKKNESLNLEISTSSNFAGSFVDKRSTSTIRTFLRN